MRYADNLDGTFTNPLLFADYPDPDIIRVGADFYLVSSSFTTVPGIPVCRSRDLLNWEVIGHAYERLPEQNPAYSMQGGTAYRGGSWAPTIRHHDGRFYIGFCTPAEGFFLAIADKPEGPYELVPFGIELYDPGLLFTNDGRVFVSHGANGIFVTELTTDARAVKTPPRFIFQTPVGNPLEGSHFYQRGDYFYICLTSRAYNGIQVILRSHDVYGPYEWRVISADDMNYAGAGLHQGGFVELADGETWFFMFQDRDWVGRVPVLQPVRWEADWPVLGNPANYGKATVTTTRPNLLPGVRSIPEGSDDFESPTLHLRWQWNHNPDNTRWSLTERPGWLRLEAGPAQDLLSARNTLTQKMVGPGSEALTCLETTGLQEGDCAGLCVLNIPNALIEVTPEADHLRVRMRINDVVKGEATVPKWDFIYFKGRAENSFATFAYGEHPNSLTPLGETFQMEFTVKTFLGNRWGLFCFHRGTLPTSGYADFDFLTVATAQVDNVHSTDRPVSFAAYDEEFGTDTQRLAEKLPAQYVVDIQEGDWVRFNRVDFGAGKSNATLRVALVSLTCEIEIRLDSPDGPLIGRQSLSQPAAKPVWSSTFEECSCPIAERTGIQTLCFVFRGSGTHLLRLDSFSLV